MKILIVEDDVSINDLIKKNLSLVGYECVQAYDGNSAVVCAGKNNFSLIILDVMLPGLSGFEVMERIRGSGTPVIFLTAKSELCDRLKGLRAGAEDYIVKPFEMLELIERVRTVLRRTNKDSKRFCFDGIVMDFDAKSVTKDGVKVELTPREYELLEVLVINRNIALSRDKLIELVWDIDYDGDSRTVDTHIQRLRKKLGIEDKIKTVYKIGYRLEVNG